VVGQLATFRSLRSLHYASRKHHRRQAVFVSNKRKMKKDNKIIQILNFFYSMYMELPIYMAKKDHYEYLRNNLDQLKNCYKYSTNTFLCASSQQFHTYSYDIDLGEDFFELEECVFCSDLEKYDHFIKQNYDSFLAISNIPKLDKKQRFDKYMDLLVAYTNADLVSEQDVFLYAFVSENYPNMLHENYDYFIFNPNDKLQQFYIAFITDFHIHEVVPVELSTYNIFKEQITPVYKKILKTYNQQRAEKANKYLKLYENYLSEKENAAKPRIKPKRDWKHYKVGDVVLTRNSHDFGEIIKIVETDKGAIFTIFEKQTKRRFDIRYRANFENIRLKTDNYSLFTKKEWEKFFAETNKDIGYLYWYNTHLLYHTNELEIALMYGIGKYFDSNLFYKDDDFVPFIGYNIWDLMVLSFKNSFQNDKTKQEFTTKFILYIKRLNTNIPDFLNHLKPQLEKKKTEYIRIHTFWVEDEQQDILKSKFGADFYVPENAGYLSDLAPLAQINFAELPENDLFPTSGILQIYFTSDWLLMKENSFKAIFFEEDDFINSTKILIKKKPTSSPISSEQKIFFEKSIEYSPVCNARSFGKYGDDLKDKYNDFIDVPEVHKMGGEFCFINGTYYLPDGDVLLLQIVEDDSISIADSGAIYFYINKDALKNREFDKVKFKYDSL